MANNDDFLEQLLSKRGRGRQRPDDPTKRSRYTIDHDRWDQQSFNRLIKQMPEFQASRQKLVNNVAGEPGYDVAGDTYWALWKVQPEQMEEDQIRPDRLVNRAVMGEAMDLTSYKELRRFTEGDDIACALAFEKMEPDLEILYDRLEEQRKLEEELRDQMQQAAQAAADAKTAEQIYQEWTEDENNDPDSEEGQQIQQAVSDAQQAQADADAQVAQGKQALQDALNAATPEIRDQMGQAMQKANDDLEAQASMCETWGVDPGELRRLPAKKRIELAKKLSGDKFRRVAELFGPMKRLAFAEQKRKVIHSPEEVYDLELGDNPARLLPSELMKLDVEELELLFYKDFAEKSLVQYAMRGFEKIAKGGIIFCHDGSGSMQGDREVWAKAVGLCLLHVARKQRRSFFGIQFGSVSEIRVDDFRDTRNITPEGVIDFAEFFFGGGTNFEKPLSVALALLEDEHKAFGAVKADIVFATDGHAPISDTFMQTFKARQKALDFKVWGINIAAGGKNECMGEPLWSLCDGKVASIKGLATGGDIRNVFGGV